MVDNTIQKYQLPLFVHSLCQWAMFPSTWNSSKRKVSAEYPKKDTVERKKRYKRTIIPESSEQVQHLMQSLIDDKSKDEGHDNTGLVGRHNLGKPGLVCDDITLLDVDSNDTRRSDGGMVPLLRPTPVVL